MTLFMMQAVAQTAAVAAQHAANEHALPVITSGAWIYFAQKFLKGTAFYQAFVQAAPGADKWAHRLVAMLGTMIAVAGIHWTLTGDASNGWQFGATIPPLAQLFEAVFDAAKIYTVQQLTYEITRKDRP